MKRAAINKAIKNTKAFKADSQITKQKDMTKEITTLELMDAIEDVLELTNSEYVELSIRIEKFLEDKK